MKMRRIYLLIATILQKQGLNEELRGSDYQQ